MTDVRNWIIAGVAGFLAFLGLLAASRAADEAFYVGGWVLAVAAVGFIFWMIRRHYDDMARRHGTAHEEPPRYTG